MEGGYIEIINEYSLCFTMWNILLRCNSDERKGGKVNIVSSRLYCHDCNGWFTARLDMNLTGNHEIVCPNCKHIHYRVVEKGEVTGERYQSSMQTYYVSGSSYSTTAGTGGVLYFDSWASTTATGTW
jgi:hypothetical protein